VLSHAEPAVARRARCRTPCGAVAPAARGAMVVLAVRRHAWGV